MSKAFLDCTSAKICCFTGDKSQTSALGHQIHVGESEERENDSEEERKTTTGILSATWLDVSGCVHHFVSSHLDLSQTRAQLAHPEPCAGRPGSTLTFKYPLN